MTRLPHELLRLALTGLTCALLIGMAAAVSGCAPAKPIDRRDPERECLAWVTSFYAWGTVIDCLEYDAPIDNPPEPEEPADAPEKGIWT